MTFFNKKKQKSSHRSKIPAGFPPARTGIIKNYAEIEMFWQWVEHDCPLQLINKNGKYANSAHIADTDLAELCLTDNPLLLGLSVRSQSEWARFVIAVHPCSPTWAIWGDGVYDFGLGSDESPWIRLGVLSSNPTPPINTVQTVHRRALERSRINIQSTMSVLRTDIDNLV